jgi:Ser-tRNA(Ala) deacylase AlaX
VTSVRGSEIALDRTAFYPGGGGQPHDLGKILSCDRVWEVRKVGKDKNGGEVWHQVEGDLLPSAGTQIRDLIDWERRYRLMRTHTALHILRGVIRTKINLLPEGIPEVRTVEILGLDLQADGGTHVANTSEVGPLRIADYKSKGRINKRLVVALQG